MSEHSGAQSGRLLSLDLDGSTAQILSNGVVHSVHVSHAVDVRPGDFVSISAAGELRLLQAYRPDGL